LEPGETIERCALRELEEESGLIADPSSLKRMGFLVFKLLDSLKIMRVHVYESWTFQGSEVEVDEMDLNGLERGRFAFQSDVAG